MASTELAVSPEDMVKEFLRRLKSESRGPLEKIPEPETPPGTGRGEMGKAVGQGNASYAMAGLRDAIQSSKAMEGLQEAVKVATSLVLQRGSMGDQGVGALARAFASGNSLPLQHLDLSDNSITEQGMMALTHVIGGGALAGLEHLNLSHNHLRDDGMGMLAGILHIGRLPMLQHLDLSHSHIGEKGIRSFADAILSTTFSSWSLQVLNLAANAFGEEGAVILSQALSLGRLPHLKHLNLSLNSLGELGTQALAGMLNSGKLSSLTQLLLSRCYLSHGVEPIMRTFEAGHLPNLEVLDLSFNYFGDRGSMALAKSLQSGRLSKLLYLAASQCGIPQERGDVITGAMETGKVWKLKHLDLSNNFNVVASNLNGGDFATSSRQRTYFTSVRVDLPSLSLVRLMNKGRLNELEYLNLSHCSMTDEGLIAIAEEMEIGHVPKLRRFVLIENNIRSVKSIDALVLALHSGQVRNLQELDVGHNSFGDDVALALARALGNSSSGYETPLVKNIKEKLWNSQSPVERLLDQVLKFIETQLGFKLRQNDLASGSGNPNGFLQNTNQPRHSVKDEVPMETRTDHKLIFSAFLVLVWFLAVVVSHS